MTTSTHSNAGRTTFARAKVTSTVCAVMAILLSVSQLACKPAPPPIVLKPVTANAEPQTKEPPREKTPALSSTDPLLPRVIAATVRVLTEDDNGQGDGSGVVLGTDDSGRLYILTAFHITEADIQAVDLYSLSSGRYPRSHQRLRPVEVISGSSRRDLAILRSVQPINEEVPSLTISKSPITTLPKHAYSCGFTERYGPVSNVETILKKVTKRRPAQSKPTILWQTDSPQALGRSGGPLLDSKGNLLGIASGADNEHGYYTHHDEIVAQLKEAKLEWLLKDEIAP